MKQNPMKMVGKGNRLEQLRAPPFESQSPHFVKAAKVTVSRVFGLEVLLPWLRRRLCLYRLFNQKSNQTSLGRMTTYSEFCIDEPSLKGYHKTDCKWSDTTSDHLYLAVSVFSGTEGGTIKLFNERLVLISKADQNEDNPTEIPTRRDSMVTAFEWHPKLPLLAIGWDNGDLGCYHIAGDKSVWTRGRNDQELEPPAGVRSLAWLPDGKGIVSLDSFNVLFTWLLDPQNEGSLSVVTVHLVQEEVSDFVIGRLPYSGSSSHYVLFLASTSGMIYQIISGSPVVSEVIQNESPVSKLLLYEHKARLVAVTDNVMLYQYSVAPHEEVTELSKIKMSGPNRSVGSESVSLQMVDESLGLIAISVAGERVIRLWQLETAQSTAIIIADSSESSWAGITTVHFHHPILAAGTSTSNLILWKQVHGLEFQRISSVQVKGNAKKVSVASNGSIAVTTFTNELYAIQESLIFSDFKSGVAITQIESKIIRLFWINEENQGTDIALEWPIRDVVAADDCSFIAVNVTGSNLTSIYKINHKKFGCEYWKKLQLSNHVSQFVVGTKCTLYFVRVTDDQVQLVTKEVEKEEELIEVVTSIDDSVTVIDLDLKNGNMVILYSKNHKYFYTTYKVSEKARLEVTNIELEIHSPDPISSARINCDGTVIIITDYFGLFPVLVGSQGNCEQNNFLGLKSRSSDIHWSTNEPRLFCVQEDTTILVVIYSESEYTLKPYDEVESTPESSIIGFEVPKIFLRNSSGEKDHLIRSTTLEEFEGLNLATTKIMIDFLTLNNVDLNKMIKVMNVQGESNEKLWKNLARISVKCRDLEMGLYCVSRMRMARVGRDVKAEVRRSNSPMLGLALLAINLNLMSEAEEIYKQSGDKHALSNFYQARNDWESAIKCVDRFNLKTVYYSYARHLESQDMIDEAIKYYQLSNTHSVEVPRMLFNRDLTKLKDYCTKDRKTKSKASEDSSAEDDLKLKNWWALYCESQGKIEEAIQTYEEAKDFYNLVRLLCINGQVDQAKSLVANISGKDEEEEDGKNFSSENSGRKKSKKGSYEAALLHLGKHLESSSPHESIGYYLSCGAIKHALKVCKVNDLTSDLIKITINYGTREDARMIIDQYSDEFENDSHLVSTDVLIKLYKKCDEFNRAIETAIKTYSWSNLREILKEIMDKKAEDGHRFLSEETLEMAVQSLRQDPAIIDIVIDLFLIGKSDRLSAVEQLLNDYNVTIDEKLIDKVEKLYKTRGSSSSLSTKLAEMAYQQGKYQLAAKMFNSLGDRINSLKALIMSDQTDQVISYANIARDKQVYKIAADYLKEKNYNDSNLIKTFYKKSGFVNEF